MTATRTTWQCGACLLVSMLAGCASAPPPPAAEAPAADPAPAATSVGANEYKPAQVLPAVVPVDPASAPQPIPIAVPKDIQALIDAADRTPEDRALDVGRHPGELLTFFDIRPGMKVAELFAGEGYTTELLARAVGKNGVVYAENNKFILDRFAAAPWGARLARPINAKVVRVDRELDDPLPPEAKDLDAVFMVLVYHDTYWLKTDRTKMNAAIYAALKPGGVFAIVDHSGRTGTQATEVMSLHRIDENAVIDDVTRAGFKLAGEANFLRNPQDARDWSASPKSAGEKRGTSDRFVLKFTK